MQVFDVVVVGAGHAGCEAALAAARMGCRTLLITINLDRIAYMSCNPSVGGPAKGHLVRELAALGGEMPRNTDRTFIQIRLLNGSKGPAVQALRAQADKALYSLRMKQTLEQCPNLWLRQGIVVAIEREGGRMISLRLTDGARYATRSVVLTTGTFLAARIMGGDWTMPAGRQGDPPAVELSECLRDLGLELARMQTNTPPRIDARSIDFSLTEPQFGGETPSYFGLYYDERPPVPPFEREQVAPVYPVTWQPGWRAQLPCYMVRTNEQTHRAVRDNLHRSPIAAGLSQGTGPRYCPSFEEKIVRYPNHESHIIFLEPEGYANSEVYVQGFFTAMPVDVQEAMLHSIPATRDAIITRPGYAVEYDVVRAGQIDPSLQTKAQSGIFLAGQINGTSGYEEAAGQGWLAGVNAVLSVRGEEPLLLRRDQSYIGVMVDDLITKEHTEPYRLFTSRAEFRLLLRRDNADLRLSPVAHRLGLVSDAFLEAVESKRSAITAELDRLARATVHPGPRVEALFAQRGMPALAEPAKALQLLRREGVDYALVEQLCTPDATTPRTYVGASSGLSVSARETVEIEAKYAGYIQRQADEVERFARLEQRRIPRDFDFRRVIGMRTEAQQRLSETRPLTVGQAARLSGVNPTDVAILLAMLERGSLPVHSAAPDDAER